MPRQNMTSPVSILLAGVIVILLLLASTGAQPSANARQQGGTPTWTPCIDDNSDEFFDCIDLRDELTATADDLTATAEENGYPDPYTSPDSTGTATSTTRTPGSPAPTGTRGTSTPTQTATPALTRSAVTSTPTPEADNTSQLGTATPTATPTPSDAISCVPGEPVIISGDGPPRAPLLLYFGERPVGGGSVAANGRFALKLLVGQERTGDYSVTVRVRGTSKALRQLTCSVPAVVPTLLPTAPVR